MTTLAWIAAPIVAVLGWLFFRAVRGRPVTRFVANVVFALLLLGYLAVTAALGVFWVSRMDLPAFDLHYLFGYCVIALSVVHVAFQARALATFFRRARNRPEVAAGPRRRPLRTLLVVAALAALVVLALGVARSRRAAPVVVVSEHVEAPASRPPDDPGPPRIFVEHAGTREPAIDYLHGQSSYSRRTVLARPAIVVTERPPPFVAHPDRPRVRLPDGAPRRSRSLGAALWGRLRAAGEDRGGPDLVAVEPAPGPVSLDDLGAILRAAGGLTSERGSLGEVQLRAAASSGALHPTDVYLLSDGASVGLPAGAYYFHPGERSLVRVSAAAAPRPGAVTFALASKFDRTVWKYGPRSFRYVVLDAGHLATNLGLAAEALGWRCAVDSTYDDDALGGALGLDRDEDGLVGLVHCGREASPATKAVVGAPPTLPERADALELTRLAHRLTSVALGGSVTTTALPSRPVRLTIDAADAAEDVFSVITRRRSERSYAPSALPAATLTAIARDARWLTPTAWSGAELELTAIVRAADGLEAGVHRFDADGFHLVREGGFADAVARAGLDQELLRRAAAVLVWSIRDEALGTIAGPRDYRNALFAVGMAGQTAYLSATARGVAVCGVGAFYDDEVAELLGAAARGSRAVYLMGLGRPAGGALASEADER